MKWKKKIKKEFISKYITLNALSHKENGMKTNVCFVFENDWTHSWPEPLVVTNVFFDVVVFIFSSNDKDPSFIKTSLKQSGSVIKQKIDFPKIQ